MKLCVNICVSFVSSSCEVMCHYVRACVCVCVSIVSTGVLIRP